MFQLRMIVMTPGMNAGVHAQAFSAACRRQGLLHSRSRTTGEAPLLAQSHHQAVGRSFELPQPVGCSSCTHKQKKSVHMLLMGR